MADYLHGVETIEIDTGPRPVRLVKTAVIGLIGTAVAGPVNTPVLVSSDRDFAQFGPAVQGSTIRDALDGYYDQKPTVVIVVNVLDPTMHKTAVPMEQADVSLDGRISLSHYGVSDVVIKSLDGATIYTLDIDYTLDQVSGVVRRVPTGAIPASTLSATQQVIATYSYADPTMVTAFDIIGGIDAAGKRLGMKALRDSFTLFGFFPKILNAPVYASLSSVSTELASLASQLRAITYIDAPIGLTPQQVITGRGPAGTINFNTSSDRVGLCYPHVRVYDTDLDAQVLRPLSIYACGAQSRKDQENGYWWSASNTELLGITGMERPIDAMINDPNSEANLLNGAGIVTLFNSFGTGIRLWGNRSAAYPSNTSPKNFLCVRRVADIIAESLEYFSLQYQDRPLTSALIDDIVESGNRFLRKLKADGAVIDGKVWYDSTLNPSAELAAGHLTIVYDFMPPTPAERVSYQATINIDYLNQLGKKS